MIDELLDILDGACEMFSIPATIVRKDGRKIENITVCAESAASEQFPGQYPMGISDVMFSIGVDAFLSADDKFEGPEPGDAIETPRGRYKIVKDPQTGKAFDWRWTQPGKRVLVRTQELKGDI